MLKYLFFWQKGMRVPKFAHLEWGGWSPEARLVSKYGMPSWCLVPPPPPPPPPPPDAVPVLTLYRKEMKEERIWRCDDYDWSGGGRACVYVCMYAYMYVHICTYSRNHAWLVPLSDPRVHTRSFIPSELRKFWNLVLTTPSSHRL